MSDTNNPYAPTADHLAVATVEEVPRLDPPQSVQYALSAEMLTAFWTHRTLTSSGDNAIRARVARRMLATCVVATAALLALAYVGTLSDWFAVPLAVGLLLLLAITYNARRPASIRLAFAQAAHRLLDESANEHLLSVRTVTLEADGLRQKMPASESFMRWEAFERIDHDDDHLFLYDSSFTAVVVPRQAFATRGQFLGFLELAKRLQASS